MLLHEEKNPTKSGSCLCHIAKAPTKSGSRLCHIAKTSIKSGSRFFTTKKAEKISIYILSYRKRAVFFLSGMFHGDINRCVFMTDNIFPTLTMPIIMLSFIF
jgi:hypothetical protein